MTVRTLSLCFWEGFPSSVDQSLEDLQTDKLGSTTVSRVSSVRVNADIRRTFVCGYNDRSIISGTRVQAS